MAALLGAMAWAARADVTMADYDGPGQFSYAVEFMPDLDQRRAGLPSDGSLHCAPTSVMDLLGYAANFGFPDLAPGPGVWAGAERHLEMTFRLLALGEMTGTDAGATTLGGMLAGANTWFATYASGPMVFVTFAKGGGYWPTIGGGVSMATAGSVAGFCFGRYEFEPGPEWIPSLTTRGLGHCVTRRSGTTSLPRNSSRWDR